MIHPSPKLPHFVEQSTPIASELCPWKEGKLFTALLLAHSTQNGEQKRLSHPNPRFFFRHTKKLEKEAIRCTSISFLRGKNILKGFFSEAEQRLKCHAFFCLEKRWVTVIVFVRMRLSFVPCTHLLCTKKRAHDASGNSSYFFLLLPFFNKI